MPIEMIQTSALAITTPEVGDVEDLENWTFDMKRNKRRRKLKGVASYPVSNKQIDKHQNSERGNTRLMMEMIDTIMAEKPEIEEAFGYNNDNTINNSQMDENEEEEEQIEDENGSKAETTKKKYIYRQPTKIFGNPNSKVASGLNNFKINQDLLRQVLIRKMQILHDSFTPYADDLGALKHKTRELTVSTISRFKLLKEQFRNSTEVQNESYKLAQSFQKEGKMIDENAKQVQPAKTKKEELVEFKVMVKELKENYKLMTRDEELKTEIVRNLTNKRNSMVEVFNQKIYVVKKDMENNNKILNELPKKINSLRKSMKKGNALNNRDLMSIIEECQKKLDIAISQQKELERKKSNIYKEDYEDMRLVNEDIVKLDMELKSIKVLRQENKTMLKNILFNMMAGNYAADHYDMSLVDVKLEIIKLNVEQDGRKMCPLLDEENLNFIETNCETRQNVREYEIKLKDVSDKIRKECGGAVDLIVVKTKDRHMDKRNFFSDIDAKFFEDIDKKLRDPKLLQNNAGSNVVQSDELADVQHILLDHKREYDQQKDIEKKRMLKKYENFLNVKEPKQEHASIIKFKGLKSKGAEMIDKQLEIMVKHFSLIFGITSAIKIIAGNFIKFKKALKEKYDADLK